MKNIGMFEIKTHLSEILKNQEEICITNRGREIAVIVPIKKYRKDSSTDIFKALANLKHTSPLGSVSDIQDMQREGRK